MAESKEELRGLLMKVKLESEKVGLKLNIHSGMGMIGWSKDWRTIMRPEETKISSTISAVRYYHSFETP